jgi:hypothetical protein
MTNEAELLNAFEASAEANELNAIAQPLGYAVTVTTVGGSSTDRRFTVHRMDEAVASGPSFAATDAVRALLDDIARLPQWRLDFDDPSVDFDSTQRVVSDTATGRSFSLRGWSSDITGVSRSNEEAGLYQGAQHLSVRSAEAPTVGTWFRSDIG